MRRHANLASRTRLTSVEKRTFNPPRCLGWQTTFHAIECRDRWCGWSPHRKLQLMHSSSSRIFPGNLRVCMVYPGIVVETVWIKRSRAACNKSFCCQPPFFFSPPPLYNGNAEPGHDHGLMVPPSIVLGPLSQRCQTA